MVIASKPGLWLTPKRLRAHATILALCLWCFYAWILATPSLRDRNHNLKGTDFLHFYTLGSLAIAHRGTDLYDMNAQARLATERVPDAAGLHYLPLYPPQVSLLFEPLAHFSYGRALASWWLFSAALYFACCYWVWRACPNLRNHRVTVLLIAAASPAFFNLIAWGQTSALALACFAMMFFLLRDRQYFLAGLALGCLIFKPQLGLAAAIVFVATGAWKVVAGATLSASVQLGTGIFYYGIEPVRQWIRRMQDVSELLPSLDPRPYQTHSLRTFWLMLVDWIAPWPRLSLALYLLSAAGVLALTLACWKRPSVPLPLRYSALLLASVLIAPHLTVYDLVILAPAFILMADWIAGQANPQQSWWLGTLLYFVYLLPLVGPYTRWTHVQLSVIAMTAALYMIWKVSQESPRQTA